MFDESDFGDALFREKESLGMVQELEANAQEALRRQRAHYRLAIKVPVVIQPGNASELLKFKVKGMTGDISQGGCSVIFPAPMPVGDVFRLHFDRQKFDLPLIFARCVRCRLLREDAFEAGFAFFTPVSLPATPNASVA